MIVPILLGVLTLVVLIAAFLASKYWHWAHVLTAVALYFATAGYLILLSQEQSLRWKHREAEAKALRDLERITQQTRALTGGSDELMGVRELAHQVQMLNRQRGRVWRGAVPTSEVDLATGQVRVGFPMPRQEPSEDEFAEQPEPVEPSPLTLRPDAVLYLFGQGEASLDGQGTGQYLGEFLVKEVNGREALLEPITPLALDNVAAERLINHRGPWIVYESMPIDSYERFAGFTPEELQQLLPASVVEEYTRHGGESQPDDDEFRLEGLNADGQPVGQDEEPVKFRYRRMLRDYSYLLHDLDQEHGELIALVQAATADLEKLQNALESGRRLQSFREEEKRMLQSDQALLERGTEAIRQHAEGLQSQVDKARRLLDEMLRENAEIAKQIAEAQGDLTPVASGALDIDAL